MTSSNAVEMFAVPGIPRVAKDDDLVALIGDGMARGNIVPRGRWKPWFRFPSVGLG